MSLAAKARALLAPRQRSAGPIGVDFALESLHLVQLRHGPDGRREIAARTSQPYGCSRQQVLENPLTLRSVVRRALANDRFTGRRAVVAIPSRLFRTVSINFQSAPGKDQEAQAVLKQMKDRVDGPLEDYVLDYLPVSSQGRSDERLALVAISEQRPIVNLLKSLRRAKLDVDALEIGPVAVCRLVGAMAEEGDARNVLVINSGRTASYLTLLSGRELLFDQEVAFGENTLVQQVAETLEMNTNMARDLVTRTGVRARGDTRGDDCDASLAETTSEILKSQFLQLVEEIKRVCLYAAAETRGGTVSQVYLLGSVARWPGSDRLLSSLTEMDVHKIPNPLALFPRGSPTDTVTGSASAPEVAVATGLALRGMLDG